jgi:N-methylhydantoinase A
LLSDLKVSTSAPFPTLADQADLEQMQRVFGRLRAEHEHLVQAGEVVAVEESWFADMRYAGQVHELTIPISGNGGSVSDDAWSNAIEAFHDAHERLYTFRMNHKPVDVITLRQDLIGIRSKLSWHAAASPSQVDVPEPKAWREAWFPDSRGAYAPISTPVYSGPLMCPGQEVRGPAVIEEENTTIVVHPGDHAALDDRGMYTISLAEDPS